MWVCPLAEGWMCAVWCCGGSFRVAVARAGGVPGSWWSVGVARAGGLAVELFCGVGALLGLVVGGSFGVVGSFASCRTVFGSWVSRSVGCFGAVGVLFFGASSSEDVVWCLAGLAAARFSRCGVSACEWGCMLQCLAGACWLFFLFCMHACSVGRARAPQDEPMWCVAR